MAVSESESESARVLQGLLRVCIRQQLDQSQLGSAGGVHICRVPQGQGRKVYAWNLDAGGQGGGTNNRTCLSG